MKGVQQNGVDDHYCSGTGLSKAFKYFIHNRVMATKFSTEGLYLNKKNITLMVCIEKEREEEILDLYPPELYRTNGRTSGLRI